MGLKVAFLNCRSHGDCAVITFEENGKPACIVVDGGDDKNSAKALADYLESQKVQLIDLMVGTHIDSDHINGLRIFAQEQVKKKKNKKPYVKVKAFWGPMPSEKYTPDIVPSSVPETGVPGGTISWQSYVIQSVGQNDDLCTAMEELGADILHPALDNKPKMPFKGVKIELLGPDTQIPADRIKSKALGLPTFGEDQGPITSLDGLVNAVNHGFEQMAMDADRNANNQSIVFRLSPASGSAEAKEWTFLFSGDAEEEAWGEMCGNKDVAPRLKARVLKIPHHGSVNGITDEGAQKVKPDYSVNSVGQKHGLPDEQTLKIIQGLGSKVLCTQRNQDSKEKSACYSVKAADCPAKNNADDVVFAVDTKTGKCTITPKDRACKHGW